MHLGIDPAKRTLAVSIWDDDKIVTGYKFTAEAVRWRELQAMRGWLSNLVEDHHIEQIFCEAAVVAGARNLQSTISIAETVGMVQTVAPTLTVPVGTWKMNTVGKGNAQKADVATWVKETYPEYAALCGTDQDLLDAGAIGAYGAAIMGAQRCTRLS